MTYTNNVPQANQTIASTQVPILNNFAYIDTEQQVEHAFNNVPPGQATGTHLRASMPNQADPVVLPAGCNGIYYVSGGLPKFYNGTVYTLVQNLLAQGSDTVGSGVSFQLLAAGSYMGTVSAFQSGAPSRYEYTQFWMSGAILVSNRLASGGSSNFTLSLDGSNNLQMTNGSGSAQTIKWQIIYSGSAP